MSNTLDDAMRRLQGGDRRAFDTVFELAWPPVLAACKQALGDPSDAEDAAQRALEKVFARASTYDPDRSAIAFVLATAAWEVRTVQTQRRRAAARLGSADPDASESRSNPEAEAMLSELLNAAGEAIGLLSEGDQQLVLEAIRGDEDAAAGPMPPAARKRKQRAMERLRAAWRLLYGR